MNTKISMMLLLAGMSSAAWAQNQYDVARYIDDDLNGTARFVGMGGAMSALGADISTIRTNPAGIGLFRGNDVSVSFGFNNNQAKSDWEGVSSTEKRTKMSFDQAGFVWSTKIGNKTDLRYMNFAFNYHKRANFNRQFSAAGGFSDGASLTWQMADMLLDAGDGIGYYYNVEQDFADLYDADNPYTDSYYYGTPYLAALGARTNLVTPRLQSETDPTVIGMDGWNADSNQYYSREEGGIDQYDFNVSFNVRDRYYFGLTLGIYNLDYNRYSSYGEMLTDGYDFTLNNFFSVEGSGVDVKLGAIIRPFEYSPFRIGFAVHTPIWYSMTEHHTANLTSSVPGNDGKPAGTENLVDYLRPEYIWDYRLTTPWRFNVSAGTVLGGIMAIDAEYEFAKYSSAQIDDVDGYELNGTAAVSESLKGVHTFRAGMETKLTSAFSLRAGYNFRSAPMYEDSYKNIAYTDETRTDAEYLNIKSRQAVTVGFGYRGRLFYADLAYKYDFYKADFYAFGSENISLPAVKVNNDRHQLLFTLGVHF